MKKYTISHIILGFLIIWGIQCVPADDTGFELSTEVNYTLQDSTIRTMLEWGSQRDKAQLFPYLHHPDASYRYTGALILANIIDEADIDSLALLLNDPSSEVRTMAAYALGQSGSELAQPHLVNGFRQYDSLANNDVMNATILEAIGKCGEPQFLQAMTSVSTYTKSDTILLMGQLRGIYGYMLRDQIIPEGNLLNLNRATDISYPLQVRQLSANYLSRVKNPNLSSQLSQLSLSLQQPGDPIVDMGLAILANKTQNDTLLPFVLNLLETHPDYRVKCNIIRSLANYPINQVWESITKALNDPNIHVANLAAQFVYDQGGPVGAAVIRAISRGNYPLSVKARLLAASNKFYGYNYTITRSNISQEMRALYENETNPLIKGELAQFLANDIYQANYLISELENEIHPALETSILQALKSVLENSKLEIVYPIASVTKLRENILAIFKNKLGEGKVSAAELLMDMVENSETLKEQLPIDDINPFLNYYSTPDKIGAYNQLATYVQRPVKGNDQRKYAAIDWSKLNVRNVNIVTNKGNIELEFFPLAAPQTVSQFVTHAEQGFYDNKYFHRVVPNFVVQTGCPVGDGYGTTDTYLRTEVPALHFDSPGYVGMASSGKDTESTQFFITHSPTPHLDGKYTIFARVTEGMNVVHDIEFGDQIQSIRIIN